MKSGQLRLVVILKKIIEIDVLIFIHNSDHQIISEF